MFIKRIYLKGFKNLALSNIVELDYNTDSPLQLILGQNGSGKSSLLRELSPLPAVPANYYPGGIKEIEISHNGSNYLLRSVINNTAKHSFIKDGIELNTGNGIGNIQKELVEREFNFTPIIQKLLTGELSFCGMAFSQRRELLMSISDLKLDYINSVYNKLKVADRDAVGAIKHVAKKKEEVYGSITAMGDLGRLNGEYEDLTDELKILIPHTSHDKIDMERHEMAMNNNLRKERDWAIQLKAQCTKKKGIHPKHKEEISIDNLKNELHLLEINVISINGNINGVLEEIAEISKLTDIIENNDDGLDKIEKRLAMKTKELNDNVKDEGIIYSANLSDVKRELGMAADLLLNLYLGRDETIIPCTKDEYRTIQETVDALRTELLLRNKQLEAAEHRKNVAIQHRSNAITCKVCKTLLTGKDYMPDKDFKELCEAITANTAEYETMKVKYKDLKATLDGYSAYVKHFKTIHQCIQKFETIAPFWTESWTVRKTVDRTTSAVEALRKEMRRVESLINYNSIEKEIKEMQELVRIHTLAQSSNASARKIALNEKLDKLYAAVKVKEKQIADIEAIINPYTLLTTYQQYFAEQESQTSVVFKSWANAYAQDKISTEVKALQSRLGDIQATLSRNERLHKSMQEFTHDSNELSLNHEAYKVLIDEISPTSGLIADRMRGYLDCFMDQLNGVIASIWEYELAVELCGVEENGLDYKFPLRVTDNLVSDIGKASQGQRDVIDFAFTVVTMGYMGLQDYPLYMDEVGASFDHTHRSKLINYIKLLLESRQCAQLFMVNHYTSEYGGLSHTNTLALSETNIILPEIYNTNARIVYG